MIIMVIVITPKTRIDIMRNKDTNADNNDHNAKYGNNDNEDNDNSEK